MKRLVNPSWFEMDRLRAIRSIVEKHYEGPNTPEVAELRLKAIWYCVSAEPDKLNERAGKELADYIDLQQN